jgi:hypothetical protein
MESRDTVGCLESTLPRRFKGRQVFTYHGGRLLSQSISFNKHHTRYHVNGFGWCWWGLHFMRGKYRMVVLQFGGFAPFQAAKSVPVMVDCHFSQSHCPLYLPSYITRRFRPFHRSNTIEEVSVRDEPMAPSRSQHFNTELTSWNEDTHHQLQQHSPGDNSKRIVNMLAYMRHIMSQESWDVLLTSSATKTRQ